jgi:hypothetical protein
MFEFAQLRAMCRVRVTATVTPIKARGIAPRNNRRNTQEITVKSFHEKARECQGFSSIFLFFSSLFFISSFSKLFRLIQAASVATLPSALLVERWSLGASWVYSTQ